MERAIRAQGGMRHKAIAGATSALARAEASLQRGESEAAVRIAKRLLRGDRRNLAAHELLARALWNLHRYEDVVAATRRLILLDPYNPGYRSLQGVALQCLGKFGMAVRAFAEAARLEPKERQSSDAVIAELRARQSAIIADLLAEDAGFAARYARNPRAACESRGFEMLESSEGIRAWVLARPQAAELRARPS